MRVSFIVAALFLSMATSQSHALEQPVCNQGSFQLGTLYVLVLESKGGTCWQPLTPRPASVLRSDFKDEFEALTRPPTRLSFRYIADSGKYAEGALAVQSRGVTISSSDGAEGQVVADGNVSLYRGPVHSVCNARANLADDTDLRAGPGYLNRFSASISGASTVVRPPCGWAAG
jgi:hypothetical protein